MHIRLINPNTTAGMTATIGEAGGWAVELIPLDFYLAR